MEDGGRLKLDPLFVGLTRPTLLFGVSQMFVIFNALGCLGYFIMSSDLRAMIALIIFHFIGYIILKANLTFFNHCIVIYFLTKLNSFLQFNL